ncbi:DUF4915 domain-containing protein [Limnobacter sp.]|uniref:DUF4915 domain-containing protein n=1 Tax=Limnobacter sp. TaxID=2003368 RepID=UPI003BAC0A9D
MNRTVFRQQSGFIASYILYGIGLLAIVGAAYARLNTNAHPSVHTQVHCDPEWVALQQQLGFTVLLGTRSMGDLHVVSAPTPGSLNFHVVKFQPHSPRLHNGELYVLNSGAGEIGRIDLASGRYDCIAFVGGYGRGLSFIGDYAIFGISKPRHDGYVPDFPLHDRLKALHMPDRCQLIAVNLKTGHVIQAITFEGAAREFFDTVVIPDCRNGVIMNLDEAQHPQLITCAQNDLPVSA